MRLTHALVVALLSIAALAGCVAPEDLEWEASTSSHGEAGHDAEAEECEDGDTDASAGGGASAADNDSTEHLDPADAYTDAEPRYHNEVDGDEHSSRTIHIPLGTDRLRVALVHDSHGDIRFLLRDPLFVTVAHENVDGTKYQQEDEWAVVEDPMPGTYRLEIHIDGVSHYTVGFYIDQ